jgi:hypothetical protein
LAASATALNDIGTNQINKKFNSNENLLDESQRQDIEDIMLIEKAKLDSYIINYFILINFMYLFILQPLFSSFKPLDEYLGFLHIICFNELDFVLQLN